MKLDQIQSVTSVTDVNTSSATYVDYTGLTVTFTPNVASNFLVLFTVRASNSQAAAGCLSSFVVLLDGVIQGSDPLVQFYEENNITGNLDHSASSFLWLTGVTSASHTVKVQLKSSGGFTTNTHYGQLTVIPFAS